MNIDIVTQNEYKIDNVQTQTSEVVGQSFYAEKNNSFFYDMKTKLQDLISGFISKDTTTLDEEINSKFLDLDFGAEFDINADKIGANDAIFFVNLLNQENLINYSVEDNKISLSCDGKKIDATNPLLNMLQTSLDTKKPIRLDFDNDVTVILKLDKEGKVQAHFIPGTSEVESYLKQNIQCLKQRFDEENINYSNLSYSKFKDESSKNNSKRKRKNS